MTRIFCLGSLNLDHVYTVPRFVRAGETLSASALTVHCGGKGLNQSVAAARAGAAVLHAGAVGKDGEPLLQLLQDSGVDTHLIRVLDAPTGHAVIQLTPKGENAIVILGGANQLLPAELSEALLAEAREGDILLLQNECSGLAELLPAAYAKKLRVFLNPAPMSESVRSLPLDGLSCLAVNESEAEALAPGGLDALCRAYPHAAILFTQGSHGAYWRCGDEEIFQSAFRVEATDTTGAGDTFIGCFAAGLAAELSPAEAMRRAAAAAAIAVTRPGAANAIPTIDEVTKFLNGVG